MSDPANNRHRNATQEEEYYGYHERRLSKRLDDPAFRAGYEKAQREIEMKQLLGGGQQEARHDER